MKYLIIGLLVLGMQGVIYFMLVAFSVTEEGTSKGLTTFLNIALYALPLICLLSGALLILDYIQGWGYMVRWMLSPIPFAVLFVILRLIFFAR